MFALWMIFHIIPMFQGDGDCEFDDTPLSAHFLDHDIYFQKSCSKTQAQSGVTERKHHHLNEIAHVFLTKANMPATFWVDAIQTAVFTVNRLPTPNL